MPGGECGGEGGAAAREQELERHLRQMVFNAMADAYGMTVAHRVLEEGDESALPETMPETLYRAWRALTPPRTDEPA